MELGFGRSAKIISHTCAEHCFIAHETAPLKHGISSQRLPNFKDVIRFRIAMILNAIGGRQPHKNRNAIT